MSHYTMLSIYGQCMRQFKVGNLSWDFFSRRMKWRLTKIVVILDYYRKCNFFEKKQNKTKQNKRPKRHKSLFESKIPRPTTKEDTYCFFMIARSLADNKITAACSFDIKNINHKQLATNTGYVAIHYSNQGVSIASSLVQQNQLAASNNFITIFAWVSEWRPR